MKITVICEKKGLSQVFISHDKGIALLDEN